MQVEGQRDRSADVIDQYGTDAFRFTLAAFAARDETSSWPKSASRATAILPTKSGTPRDLP